MFDINKPRLYMALYPTGDIPGSQPSQPLYHVALIYVPKNPDVKKKGTIMYHMRNDMKGSSEVWFYERKEVYNRTWNLLSVALLGKIKDGIDEDRLHNILKDVPHKEGERCRHWVLDAITVCTLHLETLFELIRIQKLGEEGIIEKIDGHELWTKLVEFTRNQKFDAARAVPAIGRDGTKIISEIGPQK